MCSFTPKNKNKNKIKYSIGYVINLWGPLISMVTRVFMAMLFYGILCSIVYLTSDLLLFPLKMRLEPCI